MNKKIFKNLKVLVYTGVVVITAGNLQNKSLVFT